MMRAARFCDRTGTFARLCVAIWALAVAVAPMSGGRAESEPDVRAKDSDAAVAARLAELSKVLAEHDRRYFLEAAPTISDAEYDRLKAEFEELRQRRPELGPTVNVIEPLALDARATLAHGAPMLSLAKAHSASDVERFVHTIAAAIAPDSPHFVIEPKIDGVALSATYVRGELQAIATRGDGRRGENVTAVVAALLPTRLIGAAPERVEIRGELFVSSADFVEVNAVRASDGEAVFASPRHLAAGTLHARDAALVLARRLAVVCYALGEVGPESARPRSQAALGAILRGWGLPTLEPFARAIGPQDLAAELARAEARLAAYPWPTDGIVIKIDSTEQQLALGVSATAPRWAIARKFAPARAETHLRDIVWQIGRTGVLTPVAEFDPVELGGSVVARATLHNAAEVARRGFHRGDLIVIERAGEVIPAVAAIVVEQRPVGAKAFELPSECPGCRTPVAASGDQRALRCAAPRCAGKQLRQLEHFAGPAGLRIDGLGTETLARLVAGGAVRTPADLFRLEPGVLTEGVSRALERAREPEADRLLQAVGLPGVGRSTARVLAIRYPNLRELLSASVEDLRANGLGAASAAALVEHFAVAENRAVLEDLLAAGMQPRAPESR